MLISRKQLPRRTFLRGMGTLIAIPMLDAMVPALVRGHELVSRAPVRMGFVYVPNGIVMKEWTPKAMGKDFEFTRILKPLESFRDQL